MTDADIPAAKDCGMVEGWLPLVRDSSGEWRFVTNRLYETRGKAIQAAKRWKAKNTTGRERDGGSTGPGRS